AEALPYAELPLHDQLRNKAALSPEAPAVVSEAATLTYRELDDLSEALSRQLAAETEGASCPAMLSVTSGKRCGQLLDPH
ncbi:hypothetical protein NKG99_34895, partial [Mesorhizobium sp. M1409]